MPQSRRTVDRGREAGRVRGMEDAPRPPQLPPQDDRPQPIDLNALYAISQKNPKDMTDAEFKLAVKCLSTIP